MADDKIADVTWAALRKAAEVNPILKVAMDTYPGAEGVAKATILMAHTEVRLMKAMAAMAHQRLTPDLLVSEDSVAAIRFGIQRALDIARRVESGSITTTKTVSECLEALLAETDQIVELTERARAEAAAESAHRKPDES